MNINIETWYMDRELDFCPPHFTKTSTPLNDEKKMWIINNLHGRYFVGKLERNNDDFLLLFLENNVPYFEDPQEAVLYELTWS